MATKPIILSTQQVRAILDGRKSMFRRPVRGIPHDTYKMSVGGERALWYAFAGNALDPAAAQVKAPCRPGDVLAVCEKWCYARGDDSLESVGLYRYRADFPEKALFGWNWTAARYMPKDAVRIRLKVTDVRVERLHEMLCEDMRREGVIPDTVTGGQYEQWQREFFRPQWDALYENEDGGRYAWDKNPFVWVYAFKRV